MTTLKDIYLSVAKEEKMGPDGNYSSPKMSESSQKQIEDMKKFMSKDVAELAAGNKDEAFTFDVVCVRGRKMVIPKATAARMLNATMFACLYAIGDPKVDKILMAVGAKAHFMTPDGEVSVQPLVFPDIKAPVEAYAPEPEPAEDQPRHIILEEEAKPLEQKPGQMVAVYDAVTGRASTIGVIWAWNTKQPPSLCHIIRTTDGNQVEIPEKYLKPINSIEEFVELCQKAKQQ